jgi:hypothetical protein
MLKQLLRSVLFAALILTSSSSVLAQSLGEQGITIESSDGTLVDTNITRIVIQSGDLDCTPSGEAGAVLCMLGSNASELGATIDNTEFADPTIMPYPVIGGTSDSSILDLRSTNNTAPGTSSTIEICGGTGVDIGNALFNCITAIPDGITIGGTAQLSIIKLASTITQDASGGLGAPFVQLFVNDVNVAITDDAVTTGGFTRGFVSTPLITKSNAVATTSAGYDGLQSVVAYTNTGSNTFTILASKGFADAVTVGTGVSITDRYGTYIGDVTGAGAVVDNYGVFVTAQTVGTNVFPYGAGEDSIPTTVNAGEGVWGVETGAPNRIYVINESEQIHRIGYATVTGSGIAMNTGATHYFPINGRATTTNTEGDHDAPVPGALKVFHIACAVSAAPDNGGGVDSWTFTVSDDTADVTGTSCAIADTATSCTASITAGTAVAVTSQWNFQVVPANTPAAADGTCTVWFNIDAF